MNRFDAKLAAHGLQLRRWALQTLQVNVGRKCNQACRHCHVDAAPWRTEMMDEATARRIGEWIQFHRPPIVDITGGAPELNAHFRHLVETSRAAGAKVIDRCNLTIIQEPGFDWLPDYLAHHEVEVIASLPCYSEANVRKQRGQGVFEKSIAALGRLNTAGYGTWLPLHLVYNPVGAKLPGPQSELEADYREVLQREFGIVFNQLFTITNQPIARFAEDLRTQGKWDEYLELLANSFNPATVDGLMCRTTLSVGYQGELYDCDFNQMLDMRISIDGRWAMGNRKSDDAGLFLWDIAPEDLPGREILRDVHCLACTAGCGSSCSGALQGNGNTPRGFQAGA
jgi:radical SAM/Cys-rich protein